MQEEIRWSTKDGTSSKHDDEENCALAGKEKKGKGRKFQSKGDSSQGGMKKEFSKIKCFHCHELGHYGKKCPHKKVGKKPLGGVVGEALALQIELYFTFITCMVTSMMGSVWYLDSGSSYHMVGNKSFFNDLEDKDLHMHIKMGDDGRYSAIDVGTITF